MAEVSENSGTARDADMTGVPSVDEENMREALIAAVERTISEVEGRLAMLNRQQPDGEVGAETDELEAQLRSLNEQRQRVERAPAGQLGKMKAEVAAGLSATRIAAEGAAARGHQEIAMHVVEMHVEEISALRARHDSEAAEFRKYEQRSARRIEELAGQNGIDVSSVRDNRFRLLAERMAAEKRGDRAGMFRAEALLGYNNAQGLEKVGAPREEIEEAEQKARDGRERYLREREFQALEEGRKAGMSGDALRSYVDGARSRAASELDEEREKLRKSNGLGSEARSEALRSDADWRVDRSREREALTNARNVGSDLTLKGRDEIGVLMADRRAVAEADLEAALVAQAKSDVLLGVKDGRQVDSGAAMERSGISLAKDHSVEVPLVPNEKGAGKQIGPT